MGTYTTNYNLFMPSIGEQGWGELVNGNFTTIDTTMKGLRNSVGALETEIDAVDERVVALEPLLAIQVDESHNVTFPADITVNGTVSGIHVVGVGVPIRAKLTTTNKGYGTAVPANSNGGAYGSNFIIMTRFSGFEITNPDDTYSVSVSIHATDSANNSKIWTLCARNMLTGENRQIGSGNCANGYSNPVLTCNIKYCEEVYGGDYVHSMSVSRAELYYDVPN